MTTTPQTDHLLAHMRGMSAADLSMLEAGLARPDVALTTSPGSANDHFWKMLAEFGWFQAADDRFEMPNGNSLPLRNYAITEVGRTRIPELFNALRNARPQRSSEVNARMAELYNSACVEFLRQLRDRVTEVGGERSDAELLLTNMMARFVKAGRSPEEAKRALEKLFGMARKIVEG